MDAVRFSQTYNDQTSINAAHNLAPVDLARALTADLGAITPGTLLKRATNNFAGSGENVAVVNGGAAGDITVTGIATTDRLVSVLSEDTTSGVTSDLTSEFSITAANKINNTDGTATTGTKLIVTYYTPLATTGDYEPWIQGTDDVSLIAGVLASPQAVDTDTQEIGLVRVFGPVRRSKLLAWTAADGSTSATPTAAAFEALEARNIYAL